MAHTRIKTPDFEVNRHFLIIEQLLWQVVKALDYLGQLDFFVLDLALRQLIRGALADQRVDIAEFDALLWELEEAVAEKFKFLLINHETLQLVLEIWLAFFVLLLHFSRLHSDHIKDFMLHGLIHG